MSSPSLLKLFLSSLLLAGALTTPAAAGTYDLTFDITPLPLVPGEPFHGSVAGPPGTFVVWLWDYIPGQTFIPSIGTLDIAFSQFLVIMNLGFIPESGLLEFDCMLPCIDLSEIGDVQVYSQVVGKLQGQGYLLSNPLPFVVLDQPCIESGDFVTFTQGGWGTSCNGNNPGCIRDANFASVFPNGLVLGDDPAEAGEDPNLFGLVLTSSAAVEALLPNGGTAAPLSGDEVNPASSSAGILAGQLVAATINVEFDDAGVFDAMKGMPGVKLGTLLFEEDACVVDALAGKSIDEVLALANQAISGEIGPVIDVDGENVTLSDLVDALAAVNENFDNGNTDGGCFDLP